MSTSQLFSKTSVDDQQQPTVTLNIPHSQTLTNGNVYFNSSTATTSTTPSSLSNNPNQANQWNNFGGQQTTTSLNGHSHFSTKLINDSTENGNSLHSNIQSNPVLSSLSNGVQHLSDVQSSISPDWYNTQEKVPYQTKLHVVNSSSMTSINNINWTNSQKWTHQQQCGNYESSMPLSQQIEQTLINPNAPLHNNISMYKVSDFGDCHAKAGSELKWFYRDPQGIVQGPFPATNMRNWYSLNYFDLTLPIQCSLTNQLDSALPFIPLSEWFNAGKKAFAEKIPDEFVNSSANSLSMGMNGLNVDNSLVNSNHLHNQNSYYESTSTMYNSSRLDENIHGVNGSYNWNYGNWNGPSMKPNYNAYLNNGGPIDNQGVYMNNNMVYSQTYTPYAYGQHLRMDQYGYSAQPHQAATQLQQVAQPIGNRVNQPTQPINSTLNSTAAPIVPPVSNSIVGKSAVQSQQFSSNPLFGLNTSGVASAVNEPLEATQSNSPSLSLPQLDERFVNAVPANGSKIILTRQSLERNLPLISASKSIDHPIATSAALSETISPQPLLQPQLSESDVYSESLRSDVDSTVAIANEKTFQDSVATVESIQSNSSSVDPVIRNVGNSVLAPWATKQPVPTLETSVSPVKVQQMERSAVSSQSSGWAGKVAASLSKSDAPIITLPVCDTSTVDTTAPVSENNLNNEQKLLGASIKLITPIMQVTNVNTNATSNRNKAIANTRRQILGKKDFEEGSIHSPTANDQTSNKTWSTNATQTTSTNSIYSSNSTSVSNSPSSSHDDHQKENQAQPNYITISSSAAQSAHQTQTSGIQYATTKSSWGNSSAPITFVAPSNIPPPAALTESLKPKLLNRPSIRILTEDEAAKMQQKKTLSTITKGLRVPRTQTNQRKQVNGKQNLMNGIPSKGVHSPVSSPTNPFGLQTSLSPEFEGWCKIQMQRLTGHDDLTLCLYLMSLDSADAVSECVSENLGVTEEIKEFLSEFLRFKDFEQNQQTVQNKHGPSDYVDRIDEGDMQQQKSRRGRRSQRQPKISQL